MRRLSCAFAVMVFLLGFAPNAIVAQAVPPPPDPGMVPADGTPGPSRAMRQINGCARPIAANGFKTSAPSAGLTNLDIVRAWQFSTGNGVSVAVIDTGVSPNPRLDVLPGGDYVMGGDGLSDCDAHGTIVASVIAAAPQGIAPPPRPSAPVASRTAGSPTGAPAFGPVPDGVVGVAPHARLISIREYSRAFGPQNFGEPNEAEPARTLARSIVHAANLGAQIINIAVAECFPAVEPRDQRDLEAAVRYAVTVKDAVIVAAAGDEGDAGCASNPVASVAVPAETARREGWGRVRTVSSPSWFADYVLSVGAVDLDGRPVDGSLAGPWVGVAAPGVAVAGLSPYGGAAVNAYPPARAGDPAVPFGGTGFAAAFVSGVAALIRAKYPSLTAAEVIGRIEQTAHNPARGVDDRVGHGVVDPVAALTFDVVPGDGVADSVRVEGLSLPDPPPPSDERAPKVAIAFAVSLALALLVAGAAARAARAAGVARAARAR